MVTQSVIYSNGSRIDIYYGYDGELLEVSWYGLQDVSED